MTTIIIVVALLFLVVVLGISYALASILDDYFKTKRAANFRSSLISSITKSQPSWAQIKIIASASGVSEGSRIEVLRDLLSLALSGKDENLTPHVSLIEGYINADTQEEPFEDMPQAIRIHLERLREQIPNRPELLEALVEHLRDTRIENVRQRKRQNLLNIVSLIVGMIGLLIGILSMLKEIRP